MDLQQNRYRAAKQHAAAPARAPESAQRVAAPMPAATPASSQPQRTSKKKRSAWVIGSILSLLLIAAATWFLVLQPRQNSEARRIDESTYQSVLLQGSARYFGKIVALNDKFIELSDVFYLKANDGTATATISSADDVSLIKLGCELYGPKDTLVINKSSVLFWDNLRSDGQVVAAITKWRQDNPNGQDCQAATTQSTANQAAPETAVPETSAE